MPYLSNIGPHMLMDRATEQEVERVLMHVEITKPRFVTIMGGSRFTQAHAVGRELLTNNRFEPNPRVILRKWPDDGNWKKRQYKDPDVWFKENQGFIEESFIMKCSNEDMENDLTDMSHWLARQVHLSGEVGGGVAVGSFATGNPHESQFLFDEETRKGQLTPLAEALHVWHDYSVYAPHEYVALSGARTAGHPNRFREFWKMCDTLGYTRPVTVIGEHGFLLNMDPYLGWKEGPFRNGREYYEFLEPYNTTWYRDHDVDLQLFSYLEWITSNSLHVDEDFMVAHEEKVLSQTYFIPREPIPDVLRKKHPLPNPEPKPKPKPEPEPQPTERVKEITLDLSFLKEITSDRIPDEVRIQIVYKEENDNGSDNASTA